MKVIHPQGPGLKRLALALPPAFLLTGFARAELRLPAVISDGMVLQQMSSVPIWGHADPGSTVTVTADWGGTSGAKPAEERTLTGPDGRWMVQLTTPKADGTAFTVRIESGADSSTLDDVLLGEVWLCSGQSNMEWRISDSIDAARKSPDLSPEDVEFAPSRIRHFTVSRAFALEPAETCGGRWVDASGQNAMDCSAVGYFFARAIQAELDVPIGLVVSSWGGTAAQAWTSAEVVSAFPDHAEALTEVRERGDQTGLSEAELDDFWNRADDAAFFARRFKDPDFDDSHWSTMAAPDSFKSVGLDGFDGIVWYRTEVDVPPSWAGSELVLELPPIDDHDETFWNGRRVGSKLERGAWSVARRYTIPASDVSAGQASLVVRALDTGGRGGFGAGKARLSRGEEWIDLGGEWRYRRGVSASSVGSPPMPPELDQRTPSALFNGMLAPLIPYAVRGVLWYQGESNRRRAAEYQSLFPALIVDWRTRWDDLELPFYFVQIAPFRYGEGAEGEIASAELREAQARATRLPATGMALTADIGNPRDIHPKNKWEVGRRLALFALRDLYGRSELEPNGPTLRSAKTVGNDLVLSFDHVAGSLEASGETLQHFEVRNAEGAFVPAEAKITDGGQSITLRADGVTAPSQARYLWGDAGESSVQGGTGLPMAPFRTHQNR